MRGLKKDHDVFARVLSVQPLGCTQSPGYSQRGSPKGLLQPDSIEGLRMFRGDCDKRKKTLIERGAHRLESASMIKRLE
jgi:hypothetical protein